MANTYYKIPLTPTAQTFLVTLAGVQYQAKLVWRDTDEGGWFLDLSDSDSNAIVLGIPLVTGVDLLAQYPDKNFGGGLYVATDGDLYATPTFDNLGSSSNLYFSVSP